MKKFVKLSVLALLSAGMLIAPYTSSNQVNAASYSYYSKKFKKNGKAISAVTTRSIKLKHISWIRGTATKYIDHKHKTLKPGTSIKLKAYDGDFSDWIVS